MMALRSNKMDLEDKVLDLNRKLSKKDEEIKNINSEIMSMKTQMDDQRKLNETRKKELIESQALIDSLNSRLRSTNSQKFNEEAENMKNLEDYNVR